MRWLFYILNHCKNKTSIESARREEIEHKRGAKLLRKPSRMRLLLFDHSKIILTARCIFSCRASLYNNSVSAYVSHRFGMSELRKRKGVPLKDRNRNSSHANGGSKSARAAAKLVPDENGGPSWTSCGNFLLGSVIALIVGTKYALYVRELHENDMWFSNIGVSNVTLNTVILIMLNVSMFGPLSLYFLVCINYQGTVLSL